MRDSVNKIAGLVSAALGHASWLTALLLCSVGCGHGSRKEVPGDAAEASTEVEVRSAVASFDEFAIKTSEVEALQSSGIHARLVLWKGTYMIRVPLAERDEAITLLNARK